jgi:translation initiation factor IF-3
MQKKFRRVIPIKELIINEKITDKQIKIISSEGEQLGVFPLQEALDMAYEQNLDLVKVASTTAFAVCKIMDYSKHKFDQQKKEKEMRKNQKVAELKEVAFSISTQNNDLDVKKKQAIKFLQSGHKIKLICKMLDRQKNYTNLGLEKVTEVANELSAYGVIEKPATISTSRRRRELLAVVFMGPNKK